MDLPLKKEIFNSFNNNPKDGINKIKEWCANNNKDFAEETAKFFYEENKLEENNLNDGKNKSNDRKNNLNLISVGDYLGTDGEDNKKVLEHFVKQFNFKDKDYLKSLKEFLETFNLPGEAQKIDRLVESFGSKYYEQNPNGEIKSKDAAYIIAFQTIMLNTDLHSPSIPKSDKMTFEQLKNNLRGLNEKQNFSDEFLKKLYDEIKANPFKQNFIQTATGYEIAEIEPLNDKTYKKFDDFFTKKTDIKNVFSNLGDNVTSEQHTKPKKWLNYFTGYKGSVLVKAADAEVEIQAYKPGIFSRWFSGKKDKLIIQPKGGSEQSLRLAAQIAASFETKVTSINATYDYLKQDLENFYNNPKQELGRAASVAELYNQIKETTTKVQQADPEITDTKSMPLASKENFVDLKQADLGIQPPKPQLVKKPKFSSLVEELAWKNKQREQITDDPEIKKEESKVQINNHQKRLEELKQKKHDLENRKKELSLKKEDPNITREEKWKIADELAAIDNQFKSIEKETKTIQGADSREIQFNNNNNNQNKSNEPTAADLQQQKAMEAIRLRKEQRLKEEAANKNTITSISDTQILKPGVIPPPPPMPGTIPPPPPLPMYINKEKEPIVSPELQKKLDNITKQMTKEGDNHSGELAKAIQKRREKLDQNSSRGR